MDPLFPLMEFSGWEWYWLVKCLWYFFILLFWLINWFIFSSKQFVHPWAMERKVSLTTPSILLRSGPEGETITSSHLLMAMLRWGQYWLMVLRTCGVLNVNMVIEMAYFTVIIRIAKFNLYEISLIIINWNLLLLLFIYFFRKKKRGMMFNWIPTPLPWDSRMFVWQRSFVPSFSSPVGLFDDTIIKRKIFDSKKLVEIDEEIYHECF